MILTVNGLNLYYEKKGIGRAILLLHGNGENHKIFEETSKILAPHFTVYEIDTRGHGESTTVEEYHYEDMVEDIYLFIQKLKIEKPIIYGFSDGGVVALLLAKKYPKVLSKIIVSGVNTSPSGLKKKWLFLFYIMYFFNHSPLFKLMLTEPNISEKMLSEINIPVYMTVGSKDMISLEHTKKIQKAIQNSCLKIFVGEDHGSYIIKSKKIAEYILEKCL